MKAFQTERFGTLSFFARGYRLGSRCFRSPEHPRFVHDSPGCRPPRGLLCLSPAIRACLRLIARHLPPLNLPYSSRCSCSEESAHNERNCWRVSTCTPWKTCCGISPETFSI